MNIPHPMYKHHLSSSTLTCSIYLYQTVAFYILRTDIESYHPSQITLSEDSMRIASRVKQYKTEIVCSRLDYLKV